MPRKPCSGVEKSDSLDRIEQKIDHITTDLSDKIAKIDNKIDEMSLRTKKVGTKVGELSSRMNSMEVKVDGWILITKGLETKYDELKETFAFFRDDMFSHFDTVYKKLDFHKDEYHAITYGMRRIENEHKIIDHKTILDRLNKLESRN